MPKGIYKHYSQQGFQKGHRNFVDTLEMRKRLSKSLLGHNGYWMGKKRPLNQVLNGIEKRKGENHYNWKGGISAISKTARNLFMQTFEYRHWRTAVFERDDYRCFDCGARSEKGNRVLLHAHHLYSFALFPRLRLMVENGITLCNLCHYKVESFKRTGVLVMN